MTEPKKKRINEPSDQEVMDEFFASNIRVGKDGKETKFNPDDYADDTDEDGE